MKTTYIASQIRSYCQGSDGFVNIFVHNNVKKLQAKVSEYHEMSCAAWDVPSHHLKWNKVDKDYYRADTDDDEIYYEITKVKVLS